MNEPTVPAPPERRELIGDRIVLRPIEERDTPELYEAARESVAEVGRWLPWLHPDYRESETAEWTTLQERLWREGLEFQFSIRDRDSERYLGNCGLNHLNRIHWFANLGYWVRSSAAGRGIAAAAALLVARFGIEVVGLQRIEIVVDPDNLASQRVAEKLGAQHEGVARHRLRLHDRPRDAVMYSLVASDLPAATEPGA